jgi:hypothetical protein
LQLILLRQQLCHLVLYGPRTCPAHGVETAGATLSPTDDLRHHPLIASGQQIQGFVVGRRRMLDSNSAVFIEECKRLYRGFIIQRAHGCSRAVLDQEV